LGRESDEGFAALYTAAKTQDVANQELNLSADERSCAVAVSVSTSCYLGLVLESFARTLVLLVLDPLISRARADSCSHKSV